MGFSGRFVFGNGSWGADEDEHQLAIDIHDSDIATVDFRSSAYAGRVFMGFQPRDYWENPDASELVDNGAEAERLSEWVAEVRGISIPAAEIRKLLAEAGAEDADPDDDFVEETVLRFIRLLKLPVPDGLPLWD